LVAPGTAGDEGYPWAAGELAVSVGHIGRAALLPAYDETDLLADVVKRIEHGEKAFARHAVSGVDAVKLELIDQDLSAGTHIGPRAHGSPRRLGFVREPRIKCANLANIGARPRPTTFDRVPTSGAFFPLYANEKFRGDGIARWRQFDLWKQFDLMTNEETATVGRGRAGRLRS
jgi:hypothetical protein